MEASKRHSGLTLGLDVLRQQPDYLLTGQRMMREIWRTGLVGLLAVTLAAAPALAQTRAPVPGARDARVTQATVHGTICQRGYAATVRPPRAVSDAAKHRLLNGHAGTAADYELDHLIPLGLGGHPTSPNNLWLQPWMEAAMKDRDELRLRRDVCAGRMSLEQAQHEMLAEWGQR